MALTDPRSVIREILSRRPDLHAAFAPQLSAAGIQVAGPKFSGETRRRLDAANNPFSPTIAGMPPTPPPTGFPAAPPGLGGLTAADRAIPFGGTGGDPNSLTAMANRGDPSQAPDFRSRLTDARMLQGSARVPPGSGLVAAGTNPTAQVQGQLPANFMNPGNIPRTRPPQELSALGPPSPLTGSVPPSPLAGVGPSAPIIGREAPPGLNGPLSPLASRFGDQSQLPGGAFSGSLPRPPQARPFESMIAGRPMPPGGPGSLPAAPLLAGKPFPSAPGMSSRFGDQSQLASGAFTGGPPPPMAGGPTPPTPQQLEAARDQVRQMASLPQVAPPKSLQPIETTPTSTMPNPLQRAPLNLAAGVGATAQPLGSTNLPFAGIPPTPASVAQRTADVLGPLPPGAGTGTPVRSAQAPLISSVPPAAGTVPPVGTVTSQPLPPPGAISSIPPANIQSGNLNDVLALSGTAPPPAMVGQQAGQRTAGAPRGKGARQATVAAPPVVPAQEQQKPFWNAPNIATAVGAGAGLLAGGGIGGAAAGAGGGRVIGKIVQAIRNRGQNVDAQGNIIDKAGNIIGHVSDMLGKAGSSMGGIFGGGGSSLSGGGGMGGWGGPGGWGGGSSYTGGGYGGNAGGNINQGVGQRFGQR